MIKRLLSACLVASLLLGAAPAARANDDSPTIIRDTEIESILKEWTQPLIVAAGLDPKAVHIIIVQDDEINAFVAGGQNVFIYTGLIEKTKNPGEVVGVIAHELGHIRGGHLVRGREMQENASYESILGMVLGLGAAAAGAGGDAAIAGVGIGGSMAERNYLSFSRVQESSADQSALYEFNQAQMNPTGLLTFMQTLESQELLPETQQSEYVRNHPLTRDRVDAIRAAVEKSPYKDKPYPAKWNDQHDRMVAKLVGFISPGQVQWTYDDRDHSLYANYARAIAEYRENHVDKSLQLIDGLLAQEPDNPYFHELKGQMLMDYGRVGPAEGELRRAIEIRPDASLIRTMYAHALLENSQNGQNQQDVTEAISQLNRCLQSEPHSAFIQHLLATAYGYQGNEPEAQLHLAEENLLEQHYGEAKRLAQAAMGHLKVNSRSWLRAQDILSYINTVVKNKDARKGDQ